MGMLEADRRPVTAAGLDLNPAEDGVIVYVAATDTVHHLNRTASVIFGLCDGTRDAAAIAAEVGVLFKLHEPPLDETVACLSDLAAMRLIA
jgi:hypothetical protein